MPPHIVPEISTAGIIRKRDLQVELGAAMSCRGQPKMGLPNPGAPLLMATNLRYTRHAHCQVGSRHIRPADRQCGGALRTTDPCAPRRVHEEELQAPVDSEVRTCGTGRVAFCVWQRFRTARHDTRHASRIDDRPLRNPPGPEQRKGAQKVRSGPATVLQPRLPSHGLHRLLSPTFVRLAIDCGGTPRG